MTEVSTGDRVVYRCAEGDLGELELAGLAIGAEVSALVLAARWRSLDAHMVLDLQLPGGALRSGVIYGGLPGQWGEAD